MRMERVMNFKEEQKEKVEKIEAILREYLPSSALGEGACLLPSDCIPLLP